MIPGMTAPLQGPVSMSMPFTFESAARVREALASWLDHRGAAPDVVQDARLVATELVGNAVRHAAPLDNGTLLVRWEEQDAALELSVCDGGAPTQPRELEVGPSDISGRGLAIVAALSAQWWIERRRPLQIVHVRLPLD
jgi:anti-sigma regulatory factor (Ser/Thr protein kinase)